MSWGSAPQFVVSDAGATNLSHSLGLLGLGAVGIAPGLVRGALGPWLTWVDVFFVVVSVGYAVLARRFWFRVPLVGTGLAAVRFAAGAALP